MTYENYLGFSREVLLEKMRQILPEKRLTHCLGVEKAARDLAKRYGADEEQAGLAGLLHDYAKKLSDQEFLDLIDRYELDPALKNWGNNVWHGMVGIYKIQEDLGLTDPAILRSIEIHTVGSDQMSTLDKIVYVADYIEHNRAFPGVDQARDIAQVSLDRAVAYETARTVEHLAHQGLPIYPQTIETYNAFVKYLKEEQWVKTAFIIIDVQNILVETGFETEKLLEKIAYLQDQARKQQIEIIYMQHIETPEALTSEDWQLSPLLKRQENEKVFQKRYNSMFKETGLKEYLDQQGIQQLVLCGMQTEYCVDTSVKVGFEYGYKLVIPEGAVTTFDGEDIPAETLNEFYENIWAERFADVLDYKSIFKGKRITWKKKNYLN